MDEKTLQDEIQKLERELLSLKTKQPYSPVVRLYTASCTPQAGNKPLTITYEEGSGAIITDVYSEATAVLCIPSDATTQKVLYAAQDAVPVYIASNRPIKSFTQDK